MNRFVNSHLSGPGGILQLLAIAMPMVISQACETVMMFTDRLFLSQLTPIHMAAGMSGGLTAFMCTAFFIGLIGYTTPLAAQYLGSGNEKNCAIVATQALIISIAAYPVMLACIPAGHWLFEIMGHHHKQRELSIIYFDILMYGSILPLVRNSLNGFFCGVGKTRIVMISSFVTMIVNVAVNYVLILGRLGFPSLGIKGAAIGTIIGGICGFLVVAAGYYLFHRDHPKYAIEKSVRFDSVMMKKLLRFGYPGGLEFFLNLLAFDLMVLLFHSYGPDAAAAFTITLNWDLASFIPMIGVNIGVTSLVGRFMGAGEPDRAHRTTHSGLKLAGIYSALMLLLFVVFPKPLVSIFMADPKNFHELTDLAIFMVRLVALYVMADGVTLVYSGALRGAGDTFWTMVISVCFHWLLVVETVILVRVLRLPPRITWAILVVTIPVVAAAFYLRYRSGRWRRLKVVESDTAVVI